MMMMVVVVMVVGVLTEDDGSDDDDNDDGGSVFEVFWVNNENKEAASYLCRWFSHQLASQIRIVRAGEIQ